MGTFAGDTMIPWSDPGLWQEALQGIRHPLEQYPGKFDRARNMARRIRAGFDTLSPLLDNLCSRTCPGCRDICCTRATVWYDFNDILFLSLMGLSPPERQISRDARGSCSLLTPGGCRILRHCRPFICTWYFCPYQTCLVRQYPASVSAVVNGEMDVIKTLRRDMEAEFVAVVS